MLSKLPEGIFATSSDEIPNFNLKTTVVTCFIEWNDQVLVLKRAKKDSHPGTWCTPGGKSKKNESLEEAVIREVWEETYINLDSIQPITKCYIRSMNCGCDYLLAVFFKVLNKKQKIKLNFEEHQASKWVFKNQFCSLNLLPFQKESFELVYPDKTKIML